MEEILRLFGERGGAAYFGEPVSQSEHALQTAWFGRQEGAADTLLVAALLHDIGHLLHGRGEDVADRGIDAAHQRIGARWLARYFGAAVTEPIALHVEAKRYLCGRDREYGAALSPASQHSLQLQGGALSPEECRSFEAKPYWREALALRRWDDRAKVVGLQVPDWEDYLEILLTAGNNRSDPSDKSDQSDP